MSSPRVDSTLLQAHRQTPTVLVLGKLTSVNRNAHTGVIDSAGPINIRWHDDDLADFTEGKWYQIIGRIGDNLSITAFSAIDFGEDISK